MKNAKMIAAMLVLLSACSPGSGGGTDPKVKPDLAISNIVNSTSLRTTDSTQVTFSWSTNNTADAHVDCGGKSASSSAGTTVHTVELWLATASAFSGCRLSSTTSDSDVRPQGRSASATLDVMTPSAPDNCKGESGARWDTLYVKVTVTDNPDWKKGLVFYGSVCGDSNRPVESNADLQIAEDAQTYFWKTVLPVGNTTAHRLRILVCNLNTGVCPTYVTNNVVAWTNRDRTPVLLAENYATEPPPNNCTADQQCQPGPGKNVYISAAGRAH